MTGGPLVGGNQNAVSHRNLAGVTVTRFGDNKIGVLNSASSWHLGPEHLASIGCRVTSTYLHSGRCEFLLLLHSIHSKDGVALGLQ